MWNTPLASQARWISRFPSMKLIWLEVMCAFHSVSSSVSSAPLFEREYRAGSDHQFWPGDSRSLGFWTPQPVTLLGGFWLQKDWGTCLSKQGGARMGAKFDTEGEASVSSSSGDSLRIAEKGCPVCKQDACICQTEISLRYLNTCIGASSSVA